MENLFFLPQKPFMPLGTLRQQLLFPSGLVLQEMEGASLAGRLRSHEVHSGHQGLEARAIIC